MILRGKSETLGFCIDAIINQNKIIHFLDITLKKSFLKNCAMNLLENWNPSSWNVLSFCKTPILCDEFLHVYFPKSSQNCNKRAMVCLLWSLKDTPLCQLSLIFQVTHWKLCFVKAWFFPHQGIWFFNTAKHFKKKDLKDSFRSMGIKKLIILVVGYSVWGNIWRLLPPNCAFLTLADSRIKILSNENQHTKIVINKNSSD